jgi:hypothetical protein
MSKKLECPVCGWTCEETKGLFLSMGQGLSGDHCTKCWALWLSLNVPKMEPIAEPTESTND